MNQQTLLALGACLLCAAAAAAQPGRVPSANNLALVATPSTSFVSGHESLAAVNDG